MLQWILENTLIALAMAVGVCIACRYFKARPAVCHFLWALVLVRLVAPPIFVTQWPPESVRTQVASWFNAQASGLSTQISHYLSLSGGASRADNRSVSVSSAAPVQPNPIEPALQPEEMASPAPYPETPPVEVRDVSAESEMAADQNTNLSNSYAVQDSRKPAPPAGETENAESAKEPAKPTASEMTMSEMKRQEASWENLYADKEVINQAAKESGVAPGANPGVSAATLAALRVIGWALLAVWALGALVALFVHGRRIARFHAAVRRAPEAGEWLTARVRRLADDLHTSMPTVRLMPGLSSPVIWGFGKPTLLWPAEDAALAQRDGQRCEGIIVHELAHLRRRDHWVAWVEIMAISLLWWHPLAHLACRRLHEFADLACDSWVVSMLPTHRGLYAASIVDLIEQLSTAPRAALALGVGTSSRRALVERRLIMIVKERTTCRLSPVVAMLALAGVALLVPSWAGGATGWTAPPAEVSVDSSIAPAHQNAIKQAILKRRAEVYFNSHEWKAAAAAYQAIYEANPQDAQAAHRLSYSLIGLGELDRAQSIIEKQIQNGEDPAVGHYNLACIQAKRGDADQAFKELNQAVTYGFDQLDLVNSDTDLDPLRDDDRFRGFAGDVNFVISLQEQGQNAINGDDGAAAVIHFGKLVKLAPNYGQAQHMLSYSSILASRDADNQADRDELLNGAKAAEAKQLELGYLPGVARYNMACVDAIQGNIESGLDNLAESIELGFRDPDLMRDDPDLTALRSADRFKDLQTSIENSKRPRDQVQQALDEGEFELAAELIAKYGEAVDQAGGMSWMLGYALFADGQYDQAEKIFLRSLQNGHDAGDAVYNLACCEALKGNARAALGYLAAAVDAGYTDGDHMKDDKDLSSIRDEKRFEDIVNEANDARVLQNFGAVDWDHLLRQSEAEIAKDSTKGGQHLRHGWALLRLGRYNDAMAAFAQQRELGFAPSVASYNIACCQTALGQTDAAIDILAKLAQQDHSGLLNSDFVASDPDLKALHGDARFNDVIAAFAEHDADLKQATDEHAEKKVGKKEELELTEVKPTR